MNKETIYQFVRAINQRDVEAIYLLMTEDHCFIDAHGNEVAGRDKMKMGWKGYFQWFPDYQIEITEIFGEGDMYVAVGFAEGTFSAAGAASKENHWRLPAAWRAVVSGDRIRVWQVYADTKIPLDIINRKK
jgi:uncharacterized protein (TIGR02246 family)